MSEKQEQGKNNGKARFFSSLKQTTNIGEYLSRKYFSLN